MPVMSLSSPNQIFFQSLNGVDNVWLRISEVFLIVFSQKWEAYVPLNIDTPLVC